MAAHQEFYKYLTKFENLLHCGKNAKLVFECHEGQANVHLHHALGHLPQYFCHQNSANQELYNFLTKFFNLLQSGKSAHLVYESHDGQARVSLHHALGQLQPQQHPQHHSREEQYHRQSPSRIRRRVRRAMARSAATATNKETSVNDDDALDTSKHVNDAVQAESTQSVDAVKADGNSQAEHIDADPVQHCPLQPGEPTPHQPQVEQPGEQCSDSVPPPCHSKPVCPCFDVNESLTEEQKHAPLDEVPRLLALRELRKAMGLPPQCACDG